MYVCMYVMYVCPQGESGVLVLADPKYKQLLEALEPEDAERVLAFVNTAKSTPESRLKLSPDHSKSHRTKVCVLLRVDL